MGLNAQDLENRGIFAPKAVIVSGTGALNVTSYTAVASPDSSFEYYINSDSGNKMTRTGVLWIHPDVLTITLTVSTNLEVM